MDSPNLASLDRWGFEVRRVDKPWGHELIWALTDTYCGKVLFVRALQCEIAERGLELDIEFHRLYVEEVVGPGFAFHYRPGTVHRVTALEDTTIIEVSTPQLDDVVRLEDAYGREGTSAP